MSTVLSGYESWVRSNQKWFLPLLDTARSLTLFLPGRFSETELQSEAIYCGLNLISAYHDSILDRPRAVTCELKCGPVTSHITRLQHILQFLHYSEVMIEMMASRWSKGQVIISNTNTPMQKLQSWRGRREVKWIVVLMVEMIKAFCRLQMLRNNNGKMLITMTNEELVTAAAMRARERKKAASLTKWAAQHPEMPIPPALPFSDLIDMYVRHGRSQVNPHGKFLPESVTKHPRERDDFTPRVKEVLGEVLYILRPVAYVTGRLLCHDSSWRPFLLSLFIDIASRLCVDKFDELSPGERAELSRRMIMWSFYLLRSPLFERFTQFPLIRISQVLSRIPLFGLFFGNILDLIFSLQSHYFYTSAS